jgi:hypothetical protein
MLLLLLCNTGCFSSIKKILFLLFFGKRTTAVYSVYMENNYFWKKEPTFLEPTLLVYIVVDLSNGSNTCGVVIFKKNQRIFERTTKRTTWNFSHICVCVKSSFSKKWFFFVKNGSVHFYVMIVTSLCWL